MGHRLTREAGTQSPGPVVETLLSAPCSSDSTPTCHFEKKPTITGLPVSSLASTPASGPSPDGRVWL